MKWERIKFGDFAEVQPRVILQKGSAYSFIEMADVEPHSKLVQLNGTRVWNGSGGAKFEDGDVIFARITPCLEHGKTAKVSGLTNARGFGSTEFFVFRARESISDPDFIYYLSRLPVIREPAIKSMTGSSGRQRAQKTVVENTTVQVPELDEQRRIASVLSTYDNLIENNRRRIQLLEQAARLLYKEWFVHLRFPDHEHTKIIDDIPEGWERRLLGEIANITMGQSPKSIYYNEEGNGLPFHQGVTNFGVRFPTHETYCTVQSRIAEPGDILFSVRAPVGRINISPGKIVIGRGVAAIQSNRDQQNLLFYALKSRFFKEDLMGGGTIFASITKNDLHGVELTQPTRHLAKIFMEHVRPIDRNLEILQQTIYALTKARDLLLPRLMSGRIRYSLTQAPFRTDSVNLEKKHIRS